MENSLNLSTYLSKDSINKLSGFTTKYDKLVHQLLNKDISPNSKKAIFSDILHFINWHEGRFKEEFLVGNITGSTLQAYREDCIKELELSPRTVIRRFASLRLLVEEAKTLELLSHSPFKGIKAPKVQSLAPKSLTDSEVRKLIREVEVRENLRDMLIICLMLGAGLRASEVIHLSRLDIVIGERQGHALIRSGKGNKTREVPLNSKIRALLSEYQKKTPHEGTLFMGKRGELKTTIALNKILDMYSKKAGIHCHPHSLRHTFAYNYLKNNPSDIVGLAQILGHSNINTTAIYTQNRLEDLQEKVEF